LRLKKKKHAENKVTNVQPLQKKGKSILSFFTQKLIQQNTYQVNSPPSVHATPFLHESTCHKESITLISNGNEAIVADQPCPCPSALKLMQQLKVKVEAMPKDVKPAQLDHPLAAFSGDPANCALRSFENDWEEILSPSFWVR
jgi:hypothetical protein